MQMGAAVPRPGCSVSSLGAHSQAASALSPAPSFPPSPGLPGVPFLVAVDPASGLAPFPNSCLSRTLGSESRYRARNPTALPCTVAALPRAKPRADRGAEMFTDKAVRTKVGNGAHRAEFGPRNRTPGH